MLAIKAYLQAVHLAIDIQNPMVYVILRYLTNTDFVIVFLGASKIYNDNRYAYGRE